MKYKSGVNVYGITSELIKGKKRAVICIIVILNLIHIISHSHEFYELLILCLQI